jgi:Holliday junction DNA helicase RuvA
MISYLQGTIQSTGKDIIVVLTTGGIGYEVQLIPARALTLRTGEPTGLHTYLRVTDSSHTLFGFFDLQEKAFFELLLTVSGVGPKSAMNILALGSIDDISAAIARKDVKYLTAVQGMGKKTAERLVVELQQKISAVSTHTDEDVQGTIMGEVIDALTAMGYAKSDAVQVTKQLDMQNKKIEQVLKEALKLLAI